MLLLSHFYQILAQVTKNDLMHIAQCHKDLLALVKHQSKIITFDFSIIIWEFMLMF